jgi:hypothetical protein
MEVCIFFKYLKADVVPSANNICAFEVMSIDLSTAGE